MEQERQEKPDITPGEIANKANKKYSMELSLIILMIT